MDNLEWKTIKENFYFEDGSLRDIYVFNTTITDWELWVDFVNRNYEVEFIDSEMKTDFINLSVVKKYWIKDSQESVKLALIKINNFIINCHFFIENEIENDISPKEITKLDDHLKILEYMKKVSNLLNKKVILTGENLEESILFEV